MTLSQVYRQVAQRAEHQAQECFTKGLVDLGAKFEGQAAEFERLAIDAETESRKGE